MRSERCQVGQDIQALEDFSFCLFFVVFWGFVR